MDITIGGMVSQDMSLKGFKATHIGYANTNYLTKIQPKGENKSKLVCLFVSLLSHF